MKDQVVNNAIELFEFFQKYRRSSRFLFRGQSCTDWKLVPKAGRQPFVKRNDEEFFNQWKRRARAYLDKENYSEWELIAIAQHTGVPTRLLDWTHNPLIAAFFACVDDLDSDGAVFAYKPDNYISSDSNNPFDQSKKGVYSYQPSSSSNRIINQYGYFTVHSKPSTELNEDTGNKTLEKIIIPVKAKKDILFALNQFGVNNLLIFPDLEGLSKHLSWFYTNYDYWDGSIEF